ncbi:MAG: BspA family leucine-rich repeat surface protein [Candidatus Nanopelagicales bacterium]
MGGDSEPPSLRGLTSGARRPRTGLARALVALLATLLAVFGLGVSTPAAASSEAFVSTWRTTNISTGSSGSSQIRLPLISSGTYNFVVDWGDGSSSTITSSTQPEVTHTYGSSGTKTLSITGTVRGWRFGNSGDRLKLTDISNWGPLQLGNDGGYFWGAANLQISATDEPDLSLTDDLSNMFLNASALTGGTLSDWDVSGIKKFVGTFRGASGFTGDVSAWDTSQADAMNSMFRGASSFDRDLSAWDVSHVTSMGSMFRDATAFHRSLADWDIGSLTDASYMFDGTSMTRTNYDATLQSWAGQTVKPAVEFDAGGSKYTVGPPTAARAELVDSDAWTITDAGQTDVPNAPTGLGGTRAPNGATITWNAAVPNNSPILDYTVTASAPDGAAIPEPCVTAAGTRTCTFAGLTNGAVYTFTVTARNEVGSSSGATVQVTPQIDQPSTPAKPSAVALDSEAYVTWSAPTGGGTPGGYRVEATPGGNTCTTEVGVDDNPLTCTVTGLANGTDYRFTVTATNVGGESDPSVRSEAVTPGPVFATTWDTTHTRDDGTGENRIKLPLLLDGTYDFVVAWGDGRVSHIISSDVTVGGEGIRHVYETPGTYHVTMTGTIRGWNLNHGVAGSGEREKLVDVSSWGPLRLGSPTSTDDYFKGATHLQVSATDELDLTGTTSLARAFADTPAFDGAIGNWDVSAIADFSEMFEGATAFDTDLSSWDTGSATTMARMFAGATAFNHPLADWDMSQVTSLESMFAGATAFNSSVDWSDLAHVATAADMFRGATSFDQAVNWPAALPLLTNTSGMFRDATSFDATADIDMDGVTDAARMFAGASSFDQPLAWDTRSVISMAGMFAGASSFDQDLSSWDFEQVRRFGTFLNGTGLGIHNYNLLLAQWADQDVQPDTGPGTTTADRTIDVSPARYSEGRPAADRAEMVGRGFTIIDGGSTNEDIPEAPTSVGVAGDGSDATVTWVPGNDHNSPIEYYTVTARLKTAPFTEVTAQATETAHEFVGDLPEGYANYLFFITATNGVGTSPPSDTEAPHTPDAPAVVAGDGQVTVTITPAEGGARAASYVVEDVSSPSRSCTITAPATSCVVSGLTNGTPYQFKAQAVNWVDASDFSEPSAPTAPGPAFTSSWRTGNTSSGSSAANQLSLPLVASGTYDFYVSWGDGVTEHITSHNQPAVTHTYARAGTKDVTITGTMTGFRFNNSGDRLKLLDVSAWGPLRLGNAGAYFYGVANLTGTATDALDLTGTHDLSNAFLEASSFNGSVAGWDTDQVVDLTNTFKDADAFTGTGLGTWDVSGVTDMYGTFQNSGVSADLSGWQVGAVTDLHATFAGATAFDQPIGSWDTGQVQDMGDLFNGATGFDQDLSGWDTGSVTDLSGTFRDSAFGGDISGWDVRHVTTFDNLFRNTAVPTGAAGVGWYNRLLTAWAAQDVVDSSAGHDIVLTVCGTADMAGSDCAEGAPQYSPGAPARARDTLEKRGWQIVDGGLSDLRPPDRVTGVHTIAGPADATVTWDAPADNGSPITSYAVTALSKVDLAPTGSCATFGADTISDCDLGGGLASDFYFVVTATNAVGTSEPSRYDAPPAPQAPVAVPGNGSVRAVVAPMDTADGFEVRVVEHPDTTCLVTDPDMSCLLDGLTNGQDYTLQVRASSDAGSSEWSAASDPVTPGPDWFTSRWDTTRTSSGSSSARTIRLPLTDSGRYDFQVVWGDGATGHHDDSSVEHTYTTGGIKYVAIRGDIDGWRFDTTGDRKKLLDVSNWGSLTFGNEGEYFAGASNLTVSATDTPDLTGTTTLRAAFRGATSLTGGLGGWDVSGVTDMADMFAGASSFNEDIGGWDVSHVEDMYGMFFGATAFDQDLSSWDTGRVTTMRNLFRSSGFTHEVASWDIGQVTDMAGMFRGIAPMTGVRFVNWYNRLLTAWAAQDTQSDVILTACGPVDDSVDCPDGLHYYGPAAQAAHDTLQARGWTLVDGSQAAANVPDSPAQITLLRSGAELQVSWVPPADNGSPITGYRVVTDPGDQVCETVDTSCSVTGLSDDEADKYSVRITATNALGTSDPSDPYPVLRPGAPGTPSAQRGDGGATVTVPAATTGGPASRYVVTAAPGGATCQVTDLQPPLTCQVAGLTNGTAYTFSATADNDGGTSAPSGSSDPVTPMAPAHQPEFGDVERTATGFTVPLRNFAPDDVFDWAVTATSGGATAQIDPVTGWVTVTGADPAETITVTIAATAFGYLDGSAEQSGQALAARLDPQPGPITRDATGFHFHLENYVGDDRTDWEWTVADPEGDATAAFDPDSGDVTVSALGPGESATVVVRTHRAGHAEGTLSQPGSALAAALTPEFGAVERTDDGFRVPVENYLAHSTDFDWTVVDPSGDPTASLDPDTGWITVADAAPGATVTLEVRTEREGYVAGSAEQRGVALEAGLTPDLGVPVRTDTGFLMPIHNYEANREAYHWAVADPEGDPTAVLDPESGEVAVTGAAPGESVTVSVTTTRDGFASVTAQRSGRALDEALRPTFGTVTREPHGFTVPISNYLENKDDCTWAVPEPEGDVTAELDRDTGLLTVRGVVPGQSAEIEVTTGRPQHADGSSVVTGQALEAALVPEFADVTRTAGGIVVDVTNYATDGNDTTFTWSIETDSSYTFENGRLELSGAGPDTPVAVVVRTSRPGFAPGEAELTSRSLKAPVTPRFGTPEIGKTGFTVPIDNFDDSPEWVATAVTPDGGRAVIDDSGLVTVTDLPPGTESSVTVESRSSDHVPGSATATVTTAIGDALTPRFGAVTRTAVGYRVRIDNFLPGFTWRVEGVDPGTATATIDDSGELTVKDAEPGATVTVTVSATQFGYADGSAQVSGTALQAALVPHFETPTRTAGGFTVRIDNHSDRYTWTPEVTSPEGAHATISDSGELSVTGVPPGTEATVSVTTTREEHAPGTAQVSGTSLNGAALAPEFDPPTRAPHGFTAEINNFSDAYQWSVSEPPAPATAEIVDGVLIVDGLDPSDSLQVEVTTHRRGYDDGSTSVTGQALAAAYVPQLGGVTRTRTGFHVDIQNFTGAGADYLWSAQVPDGLHATIDDEGRVTVTGLAPGADTTLTVTTRRSGHADGTTRQSGVALEAAHTPEFRAVERARGGFSVAIANYAADDGFTWHVSDPEGPATARLDSGEIIVTGLAAGQSATVTVTAEREGFDTGTADQSGTALDAALTPQFEPVTRTPTGFTAELSNYQANKDTFTWTALDPDGPASAVLDPESGMVTVAGLAPGQAVTVTVTTDRTGYESGAGDVEGAALEAALTPEFEDSTPTETGFRVSIHNHDADHTWSVTGTTPAGSHATIDEDGVVTVTDVDPGTEATVTVETTRPDHAPGSATAHGRSINGPQLDPEFGDVTRTDTGFEVEITNYTDAYAWTVTQIDTEGAHAAIDPDRHLLTVTDLTPDTTATATVGTTRSGYDPGSAEITGTSLKAPVTAQFEAITRTPDGFTAEIGNLEPDDEFEWQVTATTPVDADVDLSGRVITVTGLAPDTTATVTVGTTADGYADGEATVEGRSLRAPLTPQFGGAQRRAHEVSLPVTNYDSDYQWSVTSDHGQASVDARTGTVTVTSLDHGQSAHVTLETSRAGYADGSAAGDARALDAPRDAEFGPVTRTPAGFEVDITNYSPDFAWGARTSQGDVALDNAGHVTVTRLAPDSPAVVTIASTRSGYVAGESTVTARSLKAPRIARFGTARITADGFEIPIDNFDADFRWVPTATRTADEVTMDDSGRITVSGLAPGTPSVLRVRSTRPGYAVGTAQITVSSRRGPALTPTFGRRIPTAKGFTVEITNYRRAFRWSARSTVAGARVTFDSSGQMTVAGLAPATSTTITVSTTRTGYRPGRAAVTGRSRPRPPVIKPPVTAPAAPRFRSLTARSPRQLAALWAPRATGGAPILRATVTCRQIGGPGVRTVRGKTRTLIIGRLKPGTRYRCAVTVTNRVGTSVQSVPRIAATKAKVRRS